MPCLKHKMCLIHNECIRRLNERYMVFSSISHGAARERVMQSHVGFAEPCWSCYLISIVFLILNYPEHVQIIVLTD